MSNLQTLRNQQVAFVTLRQNETTGQDVLVLPSGTELSVATVRQFVTAIFSHPGSTCQKSGSNDHVITTTLDVLGSSFVVRTVFVPGSFNLIQTLTRKDQGQITWTVGITSTVACEQSDYSHRFGGDVLNAEQVSTDLVRLITVTP